MADAGSKLSQTAALLEAAIEEEQFAADHLLSRNRHRDWENCSLRIGAMRRVYRDLLAELG